MTKAINTLPIGAVVKDPRTRYNDTAILFRIVDKNHAGYPANSITLMTDKAISVKCFDAKEPTNPNTNIQQSGNPNYKGSNIRQWLNSRGEQGKWYFPKYEYDAPPSWENTENNYNEYQSEAGFISHVSVALGTKLLTTTIKSRYNGPTGNEYETDICEVFLASEAEMGLSATGVEEGTPFPLFTTNEARLIKPTKECVEKSEFKSITLVPDHPCSYWLRSPRVNSYTTNSLYVHYSGSSDIIHSCASSIAICPVLNLSETTVVSDTPGTDGVYKIIFGNEPTQPNGITLPTMAYVGTGFEISWDESTAPAGNISGYILERQRDGGTWEQIYDGENLNFADTIILGWTTVAYRVKAYDNWWAESDYTTSETRNVINNAAPTISGADEDLGIKTGAFNYKYTVTDVNEGQIITVTEEIDGKEKRNYTAVSGVENYLEVTNAEWLEILNGVHTLKITATDDYKEAAIRILTFSKQENEIEFTLITPLPADDAITKAIMSVTRQVPQEAVLNVKVCNNGNDTIPTWEDVTTSILGRRKFFLSNTSKTARDWGFNFKISIKRNNAIGDCYVASVGGNFE